MLALLQTNSDLHTQMKPLHKCQSCSSVNEHLRLKLSQSPQTPMLSCLLHRRNKHDCKNVSLAIFPLLCIRFSTTNPYIHFVNHFRDTPNPLFWSSFI